MLERYKNAVYFTLWTLCITLSTLWLNKSSAFCKSAYAQGGRSPPTRKASADTVLSP